jgi:hypothetical protein
MTKMALLIDDVRVGEECLEGYIVVVFPKPSRLGFARESLEYGICKGRYISKGKKNCWEEGAKQQDANLLEANK